MDDLALRAGALVLFVAIFAGGVLAAEQAFPHAGSAVAAGGLQLTSLEGAKTAAPGTQVTFPVVVRNGGEAPARLLLAAPADAVPVTFTPAAVDLAPGASGGVWATLDLPATQAEGPLRVPVQALRGDKVAATLPLALTVERPAAPAGEGQQVTADYVGRFPNGTLFDTSLRAVGEAPVPKPAGFARDYQPLQVVLGAQAGTIEGFWKGLLGMGPGQSKTFVLSPEQAYGGATLTQDVPRTQEVPRLSQAYERLQHYPRSVLAENLNASSKVGDTLRIGDPSGNQRTYRITELDGANATIVWQVAPGDPFTIYPIWPGQSQAFEVTERTVVFRTTPAELDEPLTYYAFWPNMTRVKALTNSTIVLEHSPPEGLAFEVPQRGRNTVTAVGPDTITIETPNTHPLAGQTLVFDLTVRAVRAGP